MNAMLHHYEELEDHVRFYKDWYGRGWEGHLVKGCIVSRGEIRKTLAHEQVMTRLILPRLRILRAALEAQLAVGLAKPPHVAVRSRKQAEVEPAQ